MHVETGTLATLQLLSVKTGEVAMQLYQKTMSKESWPCLRLSADEAVACHLVTNAVNVYSTSDFAAGTRIIVLHHL